MFTRIYIQMENMQNGFLQHLGYSWPSQAQPYEEQAERVECLLSNQLVVIGLSLSTASINTAGAETELCSFLPKVCLFLAFILILFYLPDWKHLGL